MKLFRVRAMRTSGNHPVLKGHSVTRVEITANLKGHDFSRAEITANLKGHDFSRAAITAKKKWASAPEGNRRFLYGRCTLAALALAALTIPCRAQTQPAPQQPSQQQPAPPPPQSNPNSHVVFSRSTDENGQTTTPGPAEQLPSAAAAPIATDTEREAVTFTAYDLDVHLEPAHQRIAVRAQLTVRNDGSTPLAYIPLQISSSLDWEHISIDGRDVTFATATVNSDADHTGQLHEAAVPLTSPAAQLAPGASLTLTVSYSGVILPTAQRLLALGTPAAVAMHSDWDQIDLDFTGLRGFGNVVWLPVSSVPAVLGISQAATSMTWQPAGAARVDSARLFDEIGQLKLRSQSAHFRLRLTDEFPLGHAPTVALVNGLAVPLKILEPPAASGETSGFATATVEEDALGFTAPSLFVAIRTPVQTENTTLWTLPEDTPEAVSWSAAATAVTPFLAGWLGPHPRTPLTILDLPDPGDAPFETGALLATPVRNPRPASPASPANADAETSELEAILVHALTHAWLSPASLNAANHASPPWLDEGVARFMGTVWTEKSSGRTRALESLEADRQALALAEPASPGENAGQPLPQAYAPAYYRTKAAYVFWMLRDLAGDAALSAALRTYNSADDKAVSGSPDTFEKLIEGNSGHDLHWFFTDWVDADKGLPDITIDHVVTAPAQSGETLVGITLSNSGYAAAEIPVTVRASETSITQRILVPARGTLVRRILIQGTPTQVQANDGTIPETEASVHVTNLTTTPQ